MPSSWAVRILGVLAALLLSLTSVACGDDDTGDDATDERDESDAGDEEEEEESGGDAEACLEEAGVEVTDDFSDLPISGGPEGGPPILQTVEGIGLTSEGVGAVAFAFESPEAAQDGASTIGGGVVQGNVLLVVEPGWPVDGIDAAVACLSGGEVGGGEAVEEPESEEPDEAAIPPRTPVNDNPLDRKIRECLEEAGQEVLPDSYDPGAGRPPPISVYYPDGSGSIGTIWVFDSEAEAQQAEAEEELVPHEGGFGRDGAVLWSFPDPNPGPDLVEDVETCAASEA